MQKFVQIMREYFDKLFLNETQFNENSKTEINKEVLPIEINGMRRKNSFFFAESKKLAWNLY
jgi:hypothetical protein